MRRMIFKWIMGFDSEDVKRLHEMRLRFENTGSENKPSYPTIGSMSLAIDLGWLFSKLPLKNKRPK